MTRKWNTVRNTIPKCVYWSKLGVILRYSFMILIGVKCLLLYPSPSSWNGFRSRRTKSRVLTWSGVDMVGSKRPVNLSPRQSVPSELKNPRTERISCKVQTLNGFLGSTTLYRSHLWTETDSTPSGGRDPPVSIPDGRDNGWELRMGKKLRINKVVPEGPLRRKRSGVEYIELCDGGWCSVTRPTNPTQMYRVEDSYLSYVTFTGDTIHILFNWHKECRTYVIVRAVKEYSCKPIILMGVANS